MSETVIMPGSFKEASQATLPTLEANLTQGSGWMRLIRPEEKHKRKNSPYYGPATQFLVDCVLHVTAHNPALAKENLTPLTRNSAARYLIEEYVGKKAYGQGKIIADAYAGSDVARTMAHLNRFHYLVEDREHVLAGATVPFDDMARTCGGAALMLRDLGMSPADIPGIITVSKPLYIIGGLDGTRTPEMTDALGKNYIEPGYFRYEGAETGVVFTDEALDVIRPLLSKVGCPTAKIDTEDGKLFGVYWNRIAHYLLDDVDYGQMQAELELASNN